MQFLVSLSLPPVSLLLLAATGLVMQVRCPRWGRGLVCAGVIGLLLLALPVVSVPLLASLDQDWPARSDTARPAAIAILGGNVAGVAPGLQDIGGLTLQRLRTGAALQRITGLPVLVTGGVIDGGRQPLATLMAHSLATDFGLTPRWVEPAAGDTWDNARFSAEILKRDGIRSVFVVTHAWHMRRALIAFAAAGLAATPAPVPVEVRLGWSLGALLPQLSSWQQSYFAFHEWLGTVWYLWRASG